MLPFSSEQFVSVFVDYNTAIWPVQLGAYLLGCSAMVLLLCNASHANRFAAGVLAIMWLWTGIVYHGAFFATINKAAYLYGALFILEGASLLYLGVYHDRLRFGFRDGPAIWVGVTLVVYAAILYPLIGMWTGHIYPEMPVFGVTPCPVTLFTFGMFLLTTQPISRSLLVVPFIWSLIGGSAAVLLHVPQDWLLLVAGLMTVLLVSEQDRAGRHVKHFSKGDA